MISKARFPVHAVLLVAALTACGGGGGGSSAAVAPPAPPPAPQPTPVSTTTQRTAAQQALQALAASRQFSRGGISLQAVTRRTAAAWGHAGVRHLNASAPGPCVNGIEEGFTQTSPSSATLVLDEFVR